MLLNTCFVRSVFSDFTNTLQAEDGKTIRRDKMPNCWRRWQYIRRERDALLRGESSSVRRRLRTRFTLQVLKAGKRHRLPGLFDSSVPITTSRSLGFRLKTRCGLSMTRMIDDKWKLYFWHTEFPVLHFTLCVPRSCRVVLICFAGQLVYQ